MTLGHNGGPQVDLEKGFLVFYKDWRNHHLVGIHNPEYFTWWVDLMCDAAYEGGQRTVNGHHYELDEGDLVGAYRYLAEKWGVPVKRVRTFVDKLEQAGLARRNKKGTPKGTQAQIISVNYYNEICKFVADKRHAERQAMGTHDGTQGAHSRAHKGHKLKEVKEIKELKNIPPNPQRGNADEFPSHVQPVTNWNTAFAQPDQDGFVFGGPQGVQLVNGTQQFWLEQFDGDQKALGLALIKAAASVQPNSKQNRVQQIVRMLSSEAAAKHNSDQRYAKAAGKKAKSAKDVDIFAIMREMTGD